VHSGRHLTGMGFPAEYSALSKLGKDLGLLRLWIDMAWPYSTINRLDRVQIHKKQKTKNKQRIEQEHFFS